MAQNQKHITLGVISFGLALQSVIVPLALLTIAIGGLTAAYFKMKGAVNEAVDAQDRFAASTKTVAQRMMEGRAVALEFNGVTVKQVRNMSNLDAVARRLTLGIRGL